MQYGHLSKQYQGSVPHTVAVHVNQNRTSTNVSVTARDVLRSQGTNLNGDSHDCTVDCAVVVVCLFCYDNLKKVGRAT